MTTGTAGSVNGPSFPSESEGLAGKGGSTGVTGDNPGGRFGGGMTESDIDVSHVKNELSIKRRRKKKGCQGERKNPTKPQIYK